MTHISAIHTAVPSFLHAQMDILRFMQTYLSLDVRTSRMAQLLYRRSGIEQRYSCLPDFSGETSEKMLFSRSVVSVSKRLEIYEKEALQLSKEALEGVLEGIDKQTITHLITVSCTGMSAPGLDIQLVKALGLSPTIVRTSVNFMGCYAALHGLKLADAFCQSGKPTRVLVVCVELCTLHLQQDASLEAITSGLLFADGAAACLVENQSNEKGGIQIDSFFSKLALEGEKDMAWHISETGFLMRLSSYVPKLVETELQVLVNEALQEAGIEEVKHWLIHPGGKEIVQAAQKSLQITEEQLKPAYQILKNYGNMSSATILFVLKEWWETNPEAQNEPAFVAAFGPGITMESMLVRLV
ncbi:MAG: type III polyketide synthase [Spirosomataceae bacterium]